MENTSPRTQRVSSLSDDEVAALDSLVVSLEAVRRGIAAFQALEANILNAALAMALEHVDPDRPGGDLPVREVAAEIGAALRVSDRTVQRQLDQARTLSEDFPATHDALTAGWISRAHVAVITDAGARLDRDLRAQFEAAALPVAERESAARLKPFARMVAERLLPRPFEERHADAAENRRVWVSDLDDGMAELLAVLPAALAHGISDRLHQQASAVRDADPAEERTRDQLRADLLADMLLTATPVAHDQSALLGAIRADVHVTVPVLTMAGACDEPALLDGVVPIDPDTARRLVGAEHGWDRVLTHPVTGAVLAVDRYRPSAELRRFLRAVDQRCRFPGCMVPARRCDIDHVHDAALGGPTEERNLTDVCRRHHVLKHHSAWAPRKEPDGSVSLTSPTGRRHPDRVMPRVAFLPEPGPPPPF